MIVNIYNKLVSMTPSPRSRVNASCGFHNVETQISFAELVTHSRVQAGVFLIEDFRLIIYEKWQSFRVPAAKEERKSRTENLPSHRDLAPGKSI